MTTFKEMGILTVDDQLKLYKTKYISKQKVRDAIDAKIKCYYNPDDIWIIDVLKELKKVLGL